MASSGNGNGGKKPPMEVVQAADALDANATELLEAFGELTEREAGFVMAVSRIGKPDGPKNQEEAAIAAGYSERNASGTATRTMARPRVQRALKALKAKAADRSAISLAKYVEMCVDAALAWKDDDTGTPKRMPLVNSGTVVSMVETEPDPDKPGHVRPVYRRDPETGKILRDPAGNPIPVERTVIEEWRPDGANTKALELIGKTLGYIIDRSEMAGPGGGPIPIAGYPAGTVSPEQMGGFLDSLPAPQGHLPPGQDVSGGDDDDDE